MDDEYRQAFPGPIIAVRSNIQERIADARGDAARLDDAERAYSQLDSNGAVSVELNETKGTVELTAWISSPDISAVDTLLKEFDAELKWDSDEELYKLEAVIWWW